MMVLRVIENEADGVILVLMTTDDPVAFVTREVARFPFRTKIGRWIAVRRALKMKRNTKILEAAE